MSDILPLMLRCPKCGAPLVLREMKPHSTKPFSPFMGCSTYPKCDGKLNVDGTEIDRYEEYRGEVEVW